MAKKSTNARTSKASSTRGRDKNGKSGGKPGGKSSAADSVEAVDLENDAVARSALLASDKLYYRIGEVSRLTNVKAHVLRYWETEFRWMAPPKSRSKQRLYRKRDIEFVWLLKRLLWEERYTIAGARQRIQELGVEDALALLDQLPGDTASVAATSRPLAGQVGSATPPEDMRANEAGEAARGADRAAWVSFRAALDDMQGELVALRGVLQEGA